MCVRSKQRTLEKATNRRARILLGITRGGTIHKVTAFGIKNELQNYVHDVVPINERFQTVVFKGTIPISMITAYAPKVAATDQQKEHSYDKLTQATNNLNRKKLPWC